MMQDAPNQTIESALIVAACMAMGALVIGLRAAYLYLFEGGL